MMKTIILILVIAILFVWLFLSIIFVINCIQDVVNSSKRERRDQEYHERRMKGFD
ncbi:MAG: hypothetical protein LUH03_10725 [Oscillospiraceae bacterium]|nr:hypothetical protein [Oscillospiraceae bacterium]